MKGGIEKRKNGAVIKTVKNTREFKTYVVYHLDSAGDLKLSPNNPWCYLRNARTDADNGPE